MLRKFYKKIANIICFFMVLGMLNISAAAQETQRFSDVPENHWANSLIHQLRDLKITDGVGNNNFGMGLTITRSEFVTFLSKLMKWELIDPETGSFEDNQDRNSWYYKYVETAVKNRIISTGSATFRPEDSVSREEVAIMIVRCLGYENLARQLEYLGSPFYDVNKYTGYITIVKDLGIVFGVGGNLFEPEGKALREEAAAMMMRMYQKLNAPIEELHGFYAIESYQQKDLINNLDSVSFGWSRLEFDEATEKVLLNTTNENGNLFAIPNGFEEPVNMAKNNSTPAQLMVFAQNDLITVGNASIGFVEYLLTDLNERKAVIDSITSQVKSTTKSNTTVSFDGVVIDFEGLKGKAASDALNVFLSELKQKLLVNGKKLYVAVHPKRRQGFEYFDGYDYKSIGKIADRVILMAHDYDAKVLTEDDMKNGFTDTPLTPIDEIYYALKSITDKETGVEDKGKIMLQLSFGSAQWKLRNGVVVNKYPYNPNYDAILKRIGQNANIGYSEVYQNPYIKFFDESDQSENIVWYEDTKSVSAKLKLAGMFGIQGVSVWRLGIIPDYNSPDAQNANLDVWKQIMNAME